MFLLAEEVEVGVATRIVVAVEVRTIGPEVDRTTFMFAGNEREANKIRYN